MVEKANEKALKDRLVFLENRLEEYKDSGLSLNMSRGKPCISQLDLSDLILGISLPDDISANEDLRNYGNLQGLKELRDIFSDIISVPSDCIFIGGNSSLSLEYNILSSFILFGALDSSRPWKDEEKIKFLCPVPGYDRHFYMAERLGFELIPIKLNNDGPDMVEVERLVREDVAIKGMWAVPKYSNPTGSVYSDEVIERLAKMYTKSPDFTLMWDNAYAVHDFYDDVKIASIVELCEKYGHKNRAIVFTSFSKVTYAGASVSAMGSSKENLDYILELMGMQMIGYNKVNQYQHMKFIKDYANLRGHMKRHMDILVPKFDETLRILEENLADKDIATWSKPRGGYFISFDLNDLSAKEVVQTCEEYGLILTKAGSTFPYGIDPDDKNIRLAPSFPEMEDLTVAMELFTSIVEYLHIRRLLNGKI